MSDLTSQQQQRLVELATGEWMEEGAYEIVRKIQEYDPNLRVQYLDPERASDITDAPYRILEICPDQIPRVVFSVWELDERVIERLHRADTQKGNILFGLDGANLLAEKQRHRRYEDEEDALKEMVADVLRSPKEKYSATNPVTGEKHEFTASKQMPKE